MARVQEHQQTATRAHSVLVSHLLYPPIGSTSVHYEAEHVGSGAGKDWRQQLSTQPKDINRGGD